MKITIFWDMTKCGLVIYARIGEMIGLNLHD
jgi:hypothetical protein